MATKNYTTKTASLRATKADVRTLDTKKLFIDGVNIHDLIKNGQVKVLDDRGDFVTDKDLWGTTVTTNENGVAEWTDGEKYYIILGAQKVFGDDLSTYGMFTSIENAAMNMGFTPYEYVEEN